MKKLVMGLTLGVALLAVASPYSLAQMYDPPAGSCGCWNDGMPMMRHGGMMNRGQHLRRILANLGLDEKQAESVKAIERKEEKDAAKKMADLQVARIDLRELLDKDQVDLNAAEAALKKVASIQTDLRFSRIKAVQEIKAKLTPEQKKKFNDLRDPYAMNDQMMPCGKKGRAYEMRN